MQMAVRMSYSLCTGCRAMRLLHSLTRLPKATMQLQRMPRGYRHLSNNNSTNNSVDQTSQAQHVDSVKVHKGKDPSSTDQDFDLATLLKHIQKPRQPEDLEPVSLIRQRSSAMMNVEEVVAFLRRENALDICVIHIPPERDYVNYFITCTGMGIRHVGRIADNLVAELKHVRLGSGNRARKLTVEGRDSEDWMAVDMGTLVVHFMTEEGRKRYELEKLWMLGPRYDDQCRTMLHMYNTMTERKLFE